MTEDCQKKGNIFLLKILYNHDRGVWIRMRSLSDRIRNPGPRIRSKKCHYCGYYRELEKEPFLVILNPIIELIVMLVMISLISEKKYVQFHL